MSVLRNSDRSSLQKSVDLQNVLSGELFKAGFPGDLGWDCQASEVIEKIHLSPFRYALIVNLSVESQYGHLGHFLCFLRFQRTWIHSSNTNKLQSCYQKCSKNLQCTEFCNKDFTFYKANFFQCYANF